MRIIIPWLSRNPVKLDKNPSVIKYEVISVKPRRSEREPNCEMEEKNATESINLKNSTAGCIVKFIGSYSDVSRQQQFLRRPAPTLWSGSSGKKIRRRSERKKRRRRRRTRRRTRRRGRRRGRGTDNRLTGLTNNALKPVLSLCLSLLPSLFPCPSSLSLSLSLRRFVLLHLVSSVQSQWLQQEKNTHTQTHTSIGNIPHEKK